ncbi:hypothetical protein LAZ67_13000393 [Cordylochernes scorpioides]|uniref:Transposase n=1 Tax=Cordylochernes scorpioides TaxID=51811 RepID=A0ABY6L3Q4_9ARAC|nr:hypothetical protein LAZ67_13000393 [Cordylochernes scorpioides]
MGHAFALGKSQATTDGGSPSFPGNASRDADQLFSRIVTGDESWVHHSTPETKRQSMVWKKPEESEPKKAKVTISAGKVMAIVFWDCKGVLLVDYLPPNTTVNAARYCEVLTKHRDAIKRKRPGLLSRKVLLVHDNARPHAARTTQTLLENFKLEIFTHPPYSPELAPSDFHLFPALNLHLGGMHFANDDKVQAEANHWLRRQDTAWYNSGLKHSLHLEFLQGILSILQTLHVLHHTSQVVLGVTVLHKGKPASSKGSYHAHHQNHIFQRPLEHSGVLPVGCRRARDFPVRANGGRSRGPSQTGKSRARRQPTGARRRQDSMGYIKLGIVKMKCSMKKALKIGPINRIPLLPPGHTAKKNDAFSMHRAAFGRPLAPTIKVWLHGVDHSPTGVSESSLARLLTEPSRSDLVKPVLRSNRTPPPLALVPLSSTP